MSLIAKQGCSTVLKMQAVTRRAEGLLRKADKATDQREGECRGAEGAGRQIV